MQSAQEIASPFLFDRNPLICFLRPTVNHYNHGTSRRRNLIRVLRSRNRWVVPVIPKAITRVEATPERLAWALGYSSSSRSDRTKDTETVSLEKLTVKPSSLRQS